jgi:hypothetical protein
MNERQKKLHDRLHIDAHISRDMGIHPKRIADARNSLKHGRKPILGRNTDNPVLFEPLYISSQIQLWQDLIVIGTEQLKELGVENDN